jgi:hypothetical protein
MLEKYWEYNEIIQDLFIDFKKAYDSVRKGSFVQYSHRVWGTHEASHVD